MEWSSMERVQQTKHTTHSTRNIEIVMELLSLTHSHIWNMVKTSRLYMMISYEIVIWQKILCI